MKTLKRILAITLVVFMIFGTSACTKLSDGTSSSVSKTHTITYLPGDTTSQNMQDAASQPQNSYGNTSQENSNPSNVINTNLSSQPEVTICVRVASNIYIVGGRCSKTTEYISVGGTNVTATKIIPTQGEGYNYFIGQVKISEGAVIEIKGKETGKDLSDKIMRTASVKTSQSNWMTESDYKPVFGLNSRSHYYSAILTYTKSNILGKSEKEYAKSNIQSVVSTAKGVGAEVIYLVVPSSAAVYPETVPSEYKAATGETLYKTFSSIAESSGAKVLYPLDVMRSHKNDGVGFKIYSDTDSHWTTYGAYWGVNSLMSHIASKYPSAKPRTVQEMGFYVTELYGGDMLFSFGDGNGFENYSQASYNNGATDITKIKELTTLYSFRTPTDTLSKITRGKKSVYLTKANEAAENFTNPNGAGLPSAVIVRDSFGRTAYDMVNDRFSKVTWLAEGDYTSVLNAIEKNRPNYVIYVVSERNLVKVMLNNKDITLKSFE